MIGRDRACVAGISLSLVERRDRRLRETSFSPGRKEDLPPPSSPISRYRNAFLVSLNFLLRTDIGDDASYRERRYIGGSL